MAFKFSAQVWANLQQQTRGWQRGILPGSVIIACVMMARAGGALQGLEWSSFDGLMRQRPPESPDPAVVIVGIDEADIKAAGKYPIPDLELANALRAIQAAKPRAIGLDLFRDLLDTPGRAELGQVFKTSPNLIGIESALGSGMLLTVKPPPELPPERVGIVDVVVDADGKLRRSLLASKVESGEVKYSLSLRLAALYLQAEAVPFRHGSRASEPISLGNLQLPRLQASTGSYINAQSGGNQLLLNYRSHPQPFRILSLRQVLAGQFDPEWLRDRVVLIGMTAISVNDTFMTSATKDTMLSNALSDDSTYQLIYGVEYHAHSVSQLIQASLHGRTLLYTWSDHIEYAWIALWGSLGIAFGLILQSPWKTLFSIAMSSLGLTLLCYGLLSLGWWVPLVPPLLALCAAGLTTAFFDRDFRLLLEQRSLTLKRTYDAVHNGPLQTLAAMLRNLDDHPPTQDDLRIQLRSLNHELREVYESMHQALLSTEHPYANRPIAELLYEVYEATLQRSLPGFNSIKTVIPPDFALLQTCQLTPDQKQGLCVFLQEALCNVGKHAVEASYLDISCTQDRHGYRLQIIDNGKSDVDALACDPTGRGTEQAKELAKSLRGRFERRPHHPQGMVCELVWRSRGPWWQTLQQGSKTLLAAPVPSRRSRPAHRSSRSEF
jgi:CHASE2 domain-containing sensor protein/two-component sensor histidine kinase